MPAIPYEHCGNTIFSYRCQRQTLLCLLLLLLAEFPDWICLLASCPPPSANGVQWHSRGFDSHLTQGERSSVTDTQHTKSLSTRGCECEIPLHTVPSPTQLLTPSAVRMPSSCLLSAGASQTIEYLPQQFLFLVSLILHVI